jgi:putative ABC transport system permease protein
MFLALRDLRFARGRFALMGAVVALIAILGVLLTGLSAGLSGSGISALAALPAQRFAFSAAATGDLFSRSVLAASMPAKAAAIPGVTAAAPLGSLTTTATTVAAVAATAGQGAAGRAVAALAQAQAAQAPQAAPAASASQSSTKEVDVQLFGMQPGSFIVPVPSSGQALGSTADGVLISPAIAGQGVAIGDRLTLGPSGVPATVIGETADASYSHIGVVYAPLSLWQKVHYGLPGPLPSSARQISAVALNLAPDTNATAIDRELGTRTLAKSATYSAVPGYSAETGTMTLIRVFLYLISALVVGAFFTVWTVQRRREIALLKAIGAATSYVLRDALAQVVVILLAATAAGTAIGSLAGGLLTRVGAPFALAPGPVSLSAGLLILLGIGGAVIAIRRVTSVDPLTALGADR